MAVRHLNPAVWQLAVAIIREDFRFAEEKPLIGGKSSVIME